MDLYVPAITPLEEGPCAEEKDDACQKYFRLYYTRHLRLVDDQFSRFRFCGQKDGKHFIVDQLGEYWDVTEAKTLGFRPEKFQYGIGRHTFITLDDSHLGKPEYLFDSHRVIGVDAQGEAHAYSVGKLARHEIANTSLGESRVAAAY